MRGANEEMLHQILFLLRQPDDALAASSLGAIGIHRQLLDVAIAGNRDNDILFTDEVFNLNVVGFLRTNLRAARVAIFPS